MKTVKRNWNGIALNVLTYIGMVLTVLLIAFSFYILFSVSECTIHINIDTQPIEKVE